MEERWRDGGSVALVERVLGELQVKMGVCARENVSPFQDIQWGGNPELGCPVFQLLYYRWVSRILRVPASDAILEEF